MAENYAELLDFDLNIRHLGELEYDSPLANLNNGEIVNFVKDDERVIVINSEREYEEWARKGIKIPSFDGRNFSKAFFCNSA